MWNFVGFQNKSLFTLNALEVVSFLEHDER
jgi:hypothetical protein